LPPSGLHEAGPGGLAALLEAERVRLHRRSLVKILAWADRAAAPSDYTEIHGRIFLSPDDERRARLRSIRDLEGELAALLVRTSYVLLLSFPGINVVSAAEFASEMGPVGNAPRGTRATRWTTPGRWWGAATAPCGT